MKQALAICILLPTHAGTKTGQNVGSVYSATCSLSKELGCPRLSLVSFSFWKLIGQGAAATCSAVPLKMAHMGVCTYVHLSCPVILFSLPCPALANCHSPTQP